ncbi:DUF2382 domain-containing protein [Brachybacterium sp. EF45031]|uniref:YsnF/AvaK domain-containing protein n=1 Tax=Brachybacterium sillae TaxID=2810536 RepID=UPI00217F01CC|nr:YsnF/AvaK domain-containing protein [Brachybacterium sillae]MCS6710808.1 DUF2382 domain-containing protein [Brachybacterium sillae]
MAHEHDRTDNLGLTDDGITHDGGSLTVHEEHLRVGTERVVSGRVRVRKRIVEEERTLQVTVRREEIEIIEEDADGVVGDTPAPTATADSAEGRGERGGLGGDIIDAQDDDTLEIVLSEERPVVTMEVVPVERVIVRKVRKTGTQIVSGEVQREVVEVIDESGTAIRDTDRDGDRGVR